MRHLPEHRLCPDPQGSATSPILFFNFSLLDFEAFAAFRSLLGRWHIVSVVRHRLIAWSVFVWPATLFSDCHSVANCFHNVTPLYLWASDSSFPLQELNKL